MEIIDGAALLGAGAVALALKADLHLTHRIAHRARCSLVARVGNHRLEFFIREGAEHTGLMGKCSGRRPASRVWLLGSAHRQPGRAALIGLAALGKPGCFLLCPNQLIEPACGSQSKLGGVGLRVAILCLFGVSARIATATSRMSLTSSTRTASANARQAAS